PDEQARKEADEKAWADAEKAGTTAAYTAYLQNFGAGTHVSEASQRIVALNEAARKAADEKAWADAEQAGTAAAYTAYIQNFGGGGQGAEAGQRVAELVAKRRTIRLGQTRCAPVPQRQSLHIRRTSARACTWPRRVSGLLRSMSRHARNRTKRLGPML